MDIAFNNHEYGSPDIIASCDPIQVRFWGARDSPQTGLNRYLRVTL